MKKFTPITVGLTLVAVVMLASMARSVLASYPYERAAMVNWHGNYAYTPYGRPTSLVVPPTAQMQTNWSWGVASSSISRIDHQYTRDYLGPGSAGRFNSTPHWAGNTNQFGVYYVRGPWYPTQSQNRMAHAGSCDRLCGCARNLAGKFCKHCSKLRKGDKSCGASCDDVHGGCCELVE